MQWISRGTRSRLRPIDLCLNRSFPVGRPQPHSRSPRSVRKARGVAEQGQSTSRAGSKSPLNYCFGRARRAPERTHCFGRAKQPPERPLLLSVSEVIPRTTSWQGAFTSPPNRKVFLAPQYKAPHPDLPAVFLDE